VKPFLIVALLTAVPALNPAYGQTYHSACENVPDTYKLDTFALGKGSLTLTEVDILARDKIVCANAVPERRTENSDTLMVLFQDHILACVQHQDEKRLAAARLAGNPQHVIGAYQGLENNMILLKDCDFEDF
jgi:hypothetical protein